ncbi:MAG: sugar ABC transporter substrate-binding protein [Clostridia bacterium]|nr:sugar ABC transporter substrate-binding protein [Clostridia bacterium]
MKNLKILLSVLLATAMLLTTVSALAEGYSVDVLEVKIWDNNQLAGLQQIADEWTAQSGVKVNIQVVDWDNYWTLLEAGASGGEMPDVFWMHSNNAQMYMGAQKLLDLTDYIAASDKIDLANYYPGITELYSLNDRNYAIAKDHDTIALLYNKAIFDQYGVGYPDDTWTWDDYKAAAEAITEASGGEVYGAACNTTNDQDGYFNIIYDFGGYVISEDKKSSGWDNENTMKAMNFVGSLMEKAWAPQQLVAENGTDTLFNNRKVAMISQGSWMINSFYTYEGSEDYAWAVLPYADVNGNGQADEGERCSIYNGLGWAASATTKDPNAAWSLIEWFSTEEMQLKQSELGVTLAGYIGASDAFANAFPGMNIDAFLKMESEGTLVFRPYSKYTSRWSDQYQRELVDAWNNPAVMNDVLYNLAGEMNALLAQE